MGRTDKTEGFELGGVNGDEVTRFIYTDFPALKFPPLGFRAGAFHVGASSPAPGRTKEGRSDFLTLVFLKCL